MYKRFAVKDTPTTVVLVVENEGYEIACAYENIVHLHDQWLKGYKDDYDCLTHEFAHIVQTQWDGNYVPSYGEDTYMIERFADYCRYVYAYKGGYYNDSAWELQTCESENHYSSANRFWLWLDYTYSTDKVDIMARMARAINSKKSAYKAENWANNKSAWEKIFKGTGAAGKSLTKLWKEYCKSDFSMKLATVYEYDEESELIEKYDVRNVIKKR
ncbi:MAG: hypothetical protein Q4D51_10165 [Eubacteriales bacterium]|nr:hypothetical protein [Eubacteriales bacterium]